MIKKKQEVIFSGNITGKMGCTKCRGGVDYNLVGTKAFCIKCGNRVGSVYKIKDLK